MQVRSALVMNQTIGDPQEMVFKPILWYIFDGEVSAIENPGGCQLVVIKTNWIVEMKVELVDE